jgi:hypothetical protein
VLREFGELQRQRIRLADVGVLLKMVACAVGKFSVIDEHGGAAVLRHQRIGQRQRRVRDVGAADIKTPGHRVGIRQHQRIGAEFCDLAADAPEFFRLGFAGELHAVNRDRAERRRGTFGPHRIEGIALDRDQFSARLGTSRGEPLGCRRSVQPRVKSEAVAGHKVLWQPGFRRRIDQRLDAPGLAVDLFCGLQGVAAVDENRRLFGQHDRHSGRSGKAGQPRQPLFGGCDIFVLLLIRAGNHESGELPSRQFFAKSGQPRGQRDAAFGLFECLEMGFEHRGATLGLRGEVRNAARIVANLAQNMLELFCLP